MGFLDRLFGTPTMDRLVRDVTRELDARGAQELRFDPALREMVFRLHDGQMRMYLGNLLHTLRQSRRAERAAVLQRFLDGVLADDHPVPTSYEEARPQLMPVVRRREDIGLVKLTALAGWGDDTARFVPATKPLVDDLVVALMYDRPTSMAYVNEQELPKWQVSFDHALADALDNLRALPEHGGWKTLGDGVWSGEWGDDYESSRMLLPDLIHRVGVRDPVVAVPFRNMLLLTAADNDAGVALMAKVIEERADENPRSLSFRPLRLQEAGWRAHAPGSATAAWELLHLRNEETLYATQKELLDALHERADIDVFVASYRMMNWHGEITRSFGVWADGVDTLLPRTDLIAFSHEREGRSRTLLVPWADALRIVGTLMDATDELPERRRVRSFPDREQLQALAGLVYQP